MTKTHVAVGLIISTWIVIGMILTTEFAGAQDAPDPEPGPSPHEIDTGAVTGPIMPHPVTANPLAEFEMKPGDYEVNPIDRNGLQVPRGSINTLSVTRVMGWELERADPGTDETAMLAITLGTGPCAILASEIWMVEHDPTGEFKTHDTTRLYLKSGGYIIAVGKPVDIKQRWEQAMGYGSMPATARIVMD